MSKRVWAAVAAVVILFGAAYFGSPFWAARQFRDAALSADVDRLDAAVDFPAVRESLKSQLTVALTEKMQNDPEMRSNPFAGLGMMMMPAIVGKMVDSFVTPDGLSAMMKRGRVDTSQPDAQAKSDIAYDYDYRTLDRFAVTVRAPETKAAEAPKFVFERRGLFSWKMIRLEVPTDLLDRGS
ncbi:DUF2939 domain-containing protein [Sphingomonas sp. PB4P5]|uniref:DUF2939 domain-containing protein n=1 Tax=Parasphingomonas puruogangriensis TaxID=3096155 RepID=UPI002FC9855D